jgi:hypothetical protein
MMTVPRISIEQGESHYHQSEPARQAFFDTLSARLAEGEVLFTQDVREIAATEAYDLKSTLPEMLERQKSRAILLYLNVVSDIQLFGGGYAYRRYTVFDRQFPADELKLEEALGKVLFSGVYFNPDETRAIERWRSGAQRSHEAYVRNGVTVF